MSSFIPRVSSSPPPMDEGGGFGWDDEDDDFGTFASASDSNFLHSESSYHNNITTKEILVNDHLNHKMLPENDCETFANFEAFSDKKVANSENEENSDIKEQRPSSIEFSNNSWDNCSENTVEDTENHAHPNSNGLLADSGVYSSNVSPVQLDILQISHGNSSDMNQIHKESEETDIINNFSKPEEAHIEPSTSDANSSETQEKDISKDTDTIKSDKELENVSNENNQFRIPSENIPGEDMNEICSDTQNIDSESLSQNIPDELPISAETVIQNLNKLEVNDLELDTSADEAYHKQSENNNSEEIITCQSVSQDNLSQCSSDNEMKKTDVKVNIDSVLEQHVTEQDCKEDTGDDLEPDKFKQEENSVEELNKVSELSNECETGHILKSDSQKDLEDSVKDISDSGSDLNNKLSQDEEEDIQDLNTTASTNTGVTDDNEDQQEMKVSDANEPAICAENQNDTYQSCIDTKECDFVEDLASACNKKEDVRENNEDGDWDDFQVVESQNDLEATQDVDNFKTDNDEISAEPENSVEGDEGLQADVDDYGDFRATDNGVDDSDYEFGKFDASKDNTSLKFATENTGDSNTFDPDNGNEVNLEDQFGDFNANVENQEQTDDDFGDFSANVEDKDQDSADDFGAFAETTEKNIPQSSENFGSFNATFVTEQQAVSEQSNDWAAFSEPQTVIKESIEDEEEWAGFEDQEEVKSPDLSHSGQTSAQMPTQQLANMSKHEKLLYLVTACFPALIYDTERVDLDLADITELHVDSDSDLWGHVKGHKTTDALLYQWTKSTWNSQLFSTLHIDTRNILIGHKKAPVPVYAAGLTLLEPTKGLTPTPKPDVLVDTSKTDTDSNSSLSQDSIPAAQFDWSSSGLTNPLEANNKTLNLDFLIQEQATKSSALESEFLGTVDSPTPKPTIQPLENLLANLKTSSTYKAASHDESLSSEAAKIVQMLPDLTFMKAKVLMFPVKMDS